MDNMDRNQQTFQKMLLYFTGLLTLAFVFTFPTRDRRGMVDRIRLQVGAEDLVSKQTLKEIAKEKAANKSRGPATAAMAQRRMTGKGWTTVKETPRNHTRSVAYYCNEKYNKTSCGQALNSCGDSCRGLVRKDLWAKHVRRR